MKTRLLPTVGLLTLILLYAVPAGLAHMQHAQQDATVHISIERPAEGETFYAGPASLLYSVTITGWAFSTEYDASDLDVHLKIIQSQETVDRLQTRPRADGSFFFSVTANPEGLPLNTPDPTCLECHYVSAVSLPAGPIELQVTARDPQGRAATAHRQIIMDRSAQAMIPVTVEAADEDKSIPSGLPITASAWLYEWRARYGTGNLNSEAAAHVSVEALAQAPTTYVLTVPPTVHDGVTYESVEPVAVTIPPGAAQGDAVTLRVTSHVGKLTGYVHPTPSQPICVQAIRIPDGFTFETMTREGGAFHFSQLPIASYLLSVAPEELAQKALLSNATSVDLTGSPALTATLSLESARPRRLDVTVHTEGGNPVPFAWVTLQDGAGARRVSLPGGEAQLSNLPAENLPLNIVAPGFYSQVHAVEATTDSLAVQLVQNPDTKTLEWGGGQLTIPPESITLVDGEKISLVRGWLWGVGCEHQTAPIKVGPVTLRHVGGAFALERIPEKGSWLYVLEGTATVSRAQEAPTHVQEGQMLALLPDGQQHPVPLAMTTVERLHGAADLVPPPTWQPALSAQVRDRLARVGVSIAQLVTFITYISILLSLLMIPLLLQYWWRRQHQTDADDPLSKEIST